MRTRDPRTKEELLDRMLAYDFDGDIRHLGAEPASIIRTAANKLELVFPKSGRVYELVARLPRTRNPRQEEASFAPTGGDEWTAAPGEGQKPEAPEPRRRQAGRHQERSRPSIRA